MNGLLRLLTGLFFVLVLLPAPSLARDKDAAVVMDAATGKVLYSRNAEERRFPASLTKMMTLLILFEAIEQGQVSLSTTMTASPEAASQKPTRLGLRSGDTLTVEDAIKALVVRSANDASVVIAEHLSGNEDTFAARMTKRARELGMAGTTFRNASGLPDLEQLTTAQDMALLSRRLQTDFAKYYHYFALRSFVWNGRTYAGHNRLLSYFDGADGLKTGYTRLSGYNLATSANRRGIRLIGVVMGGASAYSRDIQMAEMLETQYGKLGLGRPPSIVVAMSPLVPDEDEMDGAGSQRVVIESATESRPEGLAPAVAPAALNTHTGPAAGLMPILPKSRPSITTIDPIAATAVMMSPVVPDDAPQPEKASTTRSRRTGRNRPVSDAAPHLNPVAAQNQVAQRNPTPTPQIGNPLKPDAIAVLINANTIASKPTAAEPPHPVLQTKPANQSAVSTQTAQWKVRVGPLGDKAQAKKYLSLAKTHASNAAPAATSDIVTVKRKGKTLYQAQLGPMTASQASGLCKRLSAQKLSCDLLKTNDGGRTRLQAAKAPQTGLKQKVALSRPSKTVRNATTRTTKVAQVSPRKKTATKSNAPRKNKQLTKLELRKTATR